ncbi:unnamed protein product [Lymnaea stagnalis]|uniref:Carboxylesterase type B domain-containing protein n=1 Tax=Lymnaea stagnalis TaxID=6523 RepID=A0AAV2IB10_LYMST
MRPQSKRINVIEHPVYSRTKMANCKYSQLASDSEARLLGSNSGVWPNSSPDDLKPGPPTHQNYAHVSTSGPPLDDASGPGRDGIRYTAMTSAGVQEVGEYDPDEGHVEYQMYETYVRMGLVSKKRKSCSRFHVILCGLLLACVVLVAFALIYVFVILPAHKGHVVFSDGKSHLEDFDKIKLLGENVVGTSCGLVRGQTESGAVTFRGIPYAIPPTGKRRWRRPSYASYDTNSCWRGVLNATQFGSVCAQPKFGDVTEMVGSEDCLYLNVWTPSLKPAELLPVMVWIHSGDLVYGSGHMPGMFPTPAIAVATGAVYVSFNYRLGPLGFLALDQLREGREKSAGNYGFMDQQLALKWVQDSIGSFGGNKNLVTVFGHGSGATSIQALLLSAASSGLFHKAWLTSPVALLNKTLGDACQDNRPFLKKSGCEDADCLRELTPLQVLRSSPWPLEPQWTLDNIFKIPVSGQIRNSLAIFDGHVIHSSSLTSGPQGPVVPIVLGTTYFDLSSLKSEQMLLNMTWAEYDDTLVHYEGVLGADALRRVRELYSHNITMSYSGPAHFPPLPSAQLARLLGDVKTVCPVQLLADRLVSLYAANAPVYMYVAEIYPTHSMLLSSDLSNTFVGWDVAAFFDSFRDLDFLEGQGDVNFQNIIREQIMSFVTSGRPDASRWKTADVSTGIISTDITVAPVTREYFSKCDLWRRLGFFGYTWAKDS